MSAAKQVAKAVQHHAQQEAKARDRGVQFGVIRRIRPEMKVELFESEIVLTEGLDMWLTQFLRWWDVQYSLRVDDVLCLAKLVSQEWLAFDLRTTRNPDAGIRMNRPPAALGLDVRPLADSGDPALSVSMSGEAIVVGGFADLSSASGSATFRDNHIIKKMEVYDKEGVRIGWLPVYDSLP